MREPGDDEEREFGIPVSELLKAELEPPKWVIPNYIQEQNIAILAGPPNVGKTLLAFDWCAQAVAAGKRVFIGQNEGGLRGLQDRLRRACNAAGIDNPPSRFTYRRNLELALSDFRAVKQFAEQLILHDLILLDSLASFWPGLDENDPKHMGIVAEALKIICETTGASILGNHHTTKAAWKVGEAPTLADIRGHGTLGGRIDAAFICVPQERQAGVVRFELHCVKQRDEDWAPPRKVEVLMTGPSAVVTSAAMERAPLQLTASQQRAKDMEPEVLKEAPEGEDNAISANAIVDRIGKHKPTVLACIKTLTLTGKLKQRGNGRIYRMKAHLPSDSGRYNRFSGSGDLDGQNGADDD